MVKKILFSGCSLTKGVGLAQEQQDLANYCNVFADAVFGSSVAVTNIGKGGSSNLQIFLDTATELMQNQYDYAFVAWTSYPRHVFYPGIETFDTRRWLIPNSPVIGNSNRLSDEMLTTVRDQFLLLQNEHFDIVDIVKYVNILLNLQCSTKIYFINNLCHWDQSYFTRVQQKVVLPGLMTRYTQQVLNTDNRDDDENNILYHQIHDQYTASGGIQEDRWLNLYHNIVGMKTDIGNDNSHPGPATYTKYGTFLAQRFSELNQTTNTK